MILHKKRFLRKIDHVCRRQLYLALEIIKGFQDRDAQLHLPVPKTHVELQAIQEGESSSQDQGVSAPVALY